MKSINIAHFFIGPLLLVLALVFKIFPPKEINSVYGYRTKTSMQSQELWNEANRYSSNAMIVLAIVVILVQGITYKFLGPNKSLIVAVIIMVAGLIATIPLTEFHLKRFEKKEIHDRY